MISTEEIREIREIIAQELPEVIENNPDLHRFFINLSRRYFADKTRTDDRFDRLLDEMRDDRIVQKQKWDDLQVTLQKDREEQKQKWDDLQVTLQKDREEQKNKWDANQQIIKQILADIQALHRKHDTTIGALGARWGLHTEQSFRNALKGILEDFAGVQVLNVTEYDDAGVVFGRPDQVELDIIIKNGMLIIAEIKSSMSKSDMYYFEKKVRFYEERHQRNASKMIVISPMVSPNAVPLAEKLGIDIYSYAEDVPL